MANRLKDFYQTEEVLLVDLERDKEVEQIIRDAGTAKAASRSKNFQFEDAAAVSIVLAHKRANLIKHLQARIRAKTQLEREGSTAVDTSTLSYDEENALLHFRGESISIPRNTNQEALCRVLFFTTNALEYIWSWDEVMVHEKWGESENNLDNKWWRKVYNAARDVNDRVEKATSVPDLLLQPSIKEVQINPAYLQ